MAEDDVVSGPSLVKVQLWNRALSRIGQTEEVGDEGEETLAARECRKHYDDCVGEALELRSWDFAKAQCELRVGEVGVERAGWAHVYLLPEDLVAPRALVQGDLRASLEPEETRLPYELQMSDDGTAQLFCCDADLSDIDALEYTSNKASIAIWPRLFVSAVVDRLAAELALGLIKGAEGERAWTTRMRAFEAGLAVAHARRIRAAVQDQDIDSPSLRARGYTPPGTGRWTR